MKQQGKLVSQVKQSSNRMKVQHNNKVSSLRQDLDQSEKEKKQLSSELSKSEKKILFIETLYN